MKGAEQQEIARVSEVAIAGQRAKKKVEDTL